jgi:hypothetical protein
MDDNLIDLTEIDKTRLDYAWKWFDFHAKQRMQLFNYFLIITGILASAFVGAYDKSLYLLCIAVCLIGLLQAMGFFSFDVRSRELTRLAEDILLKIENEQLFLDYTSDGENLGLIRCESINKMKEGNFWSRGIKNFLKMKIWIRLIQIVIGLVFLIGLIESSSRIYHTKIANSNTPVSEHLNQSEIAPGNNK